MRAAKIVIGSATTIMVLRVRFIRIAKMMEPMQSKGERIIIARDMFTMF